MSVFNWTAILASSLFPLLVGAIWYRPFVEKIITGSHPSNKSHPISAFVLCLILSIPVAGFISLILSAHPAELVTIPHGAFHGATLLLFTAAPAFLIHFYFEGKTMRYAIYHILYWVISGGVMGAVSASLF